MPLFRSQISCANALSASQIACFGPLSVTGNTQLGSDSADELVIAATVHTPVAASGNCVYKKRILNLGDEDYTLDVSDIKDKIYMNPTSVTLRHLILTYGIGFAGQEFWIVNVGNHNLSIDDLVGPTHFGTLAPGESAIYEADDTGSSWRLVMRGVIAFSI